MALYMYMNVWAMDAIKMECSLPDVQWDHPYCLKPHCWNRAQPDFSKYSTTGKIDRMAIHKDTAIVPAGGYIVIAFKADNPGYWFLHYQIERHYLDGMSLILQEYPELQHPPLPPKLAAKVIPYWNRQETILLGLRIGLALLNLVLGLATGLIGMNYIYRKCLRGERNLLRKAQPNCDDDDDDREGEKSLGKQELQKK